MAVIVLAEAGMINCPLHGGERLNIMHIAFGKRVNWCRYCNSYGGPRALSTDRKGGKRIYEEGIESRA
jgi:hypothetical protein